MVMVQLVLVKLKGTPMAMDKSIMVKSRVIQRRITRQLLSVDWKIEPFVIPTLT